MRKQNIHIATYIIIILGAIITFSVSFCIVDAQNNTSSSNVSGWGNIVGDTNDDGILEQTFGWLSTSNTNPELDSPDPNEYGITFSLPQITEDGNFQNDIVTDLSVTKGQGQYAWSPNVGWINFNPEGTPPIEGNYTQTSNVFYTNVDPNSVDKQGRSGGRLGGWARICSVFKSGCSGETLPKGQIGSFDGWIKLDGPNYGVTRSYNRFSGKAWAGPDIGFIDFGQDQRIYSVNNVGEIILQNVGLDFQSDDLSARYYGLQFEGALAKDARYPYLANFSTAQNIESITDQNIDQISQNGLTLQWSDPSSNTNPFAPADVAYFQVAELSAGESITDGQRILPTKTNISVNPDIDTESTGVLSYQIQAVNQFGDRGNTKSITIPIETGDNSPSPSPIGENPSADLCTDAEAYTKNTWEFSSLAVSSSSTGCTTDTQNVDAGSNPTLQSGRELERIIFREPIEEEVEYQYCYEVENTEYKRDDNGEIIFNEEGERVIEDVTTETECDTETDEVAPGASPTPPKGEINEIKDRTTTREEVTYETCPVAPNVNVSVTTDNITVGENVSVSFNTNETTNNKLSCTTNWGGGTTHDPAENTVGTREYTVKCKNGEGEVDSDSDAVKVSAPACVDKFDVRADRDENPTPDKYVTSERKVKASWQVPQKSNNGFGVTCDVKYQGNSFASQNMAGNKTGEAINTPIFNGGEFQEEAQEYEVVCRNDAGDSSSVIDTITVIPAPKLSLNALSTLPEDPRDGPRVQVNGNYAVIGNEENPIELEWESTATTRRPNRNPDPCNVNNASWTDRTIADGRDSTTVDHGGSSSSISEKEFSLTCQNWLNATVTGTEKVTSLPPLQVSCTSFPNTVDDDSQSFMNVGIISKTKGNGWNYSTPSGFDYIFDRDFKEGNFEDDVKRMDEENTRIREGLSYEFEALGRRTPSVRVSTEFQQDDTEQVSCGSITNLKAREVREVQP